MPDLYRGTILRLAQEHGFQPGPMEKVVRLTALLSELSGHPFLGERMALKGGTALNVYFTQMPRLSIDADINFLGSLDSEQLIQERPRALGAVLRVAESQGYAVRQVQETHALQAYHLSYRNVGGGQDLIKLDINFLERVLARPVDRRHPAVDLGIAGQAVPCVALDELAGAKLAALVERATIRDVYDAARLAQMRVGHEAVRKYMLFYLLQGDLHLSVFEESLSSRLAALDGHVFDRQLRNLLRKQDNTSLPELIHTVCEFVEPMLRLEDTEVACVEALRRGEWQPELLFGDARFEPAVKQHPGIRWRLQRRG